MKKYGLIASIFAGLALVASAQTLTVATGSNTATYSRLLKEINEACSTSIPINEKNTSGSLENMALLTGNQVNAAFVQTDVLYFLSRTDDRIAGIKTLVALHPEEVHIIALRESKTKEGGVMGVGSKPIQVNTIEALAGRTVVAWGGSYVTAQVIKIQTMIAFNVVEVPDAATALKALDSGQAEAILAVGGQPLGFLEKLNQQYKLVAIGADAADKLKSVYRPAKLNYTNLGSLGVSTVATDALFVTREYKTAKFSQALGALRTCIYANVDELKESTGKHPKWQSIDVSNKGKWAYYDLPEAQPATKAKK